MALIVFRSPAAGSFFMFAENFRAVCEAVDKPFATQGIFRPEELPEMILRLEEAVEKSREEKRRSDEAAERIMDSAKTFLTEKEEEEVRRRVARVSFAQRAWPLLDMMKRARKMDREVVWGVEC